MAEERDSSGSSKAIEHRLDVVLRLSGLHPDGEHLVLVGPTGARYVVKVDEALRAAVRRDRPHLEKIQSEGELSPREIQIRVRAGESAAQIAESSGHPIEHVRKYEGPVVDERVYMAAQARKARVGRTSDAPELGDLVTDRLASRGVDITNLDWDASRRGTNGWVVSVAFTDNNEPRLARWAFTPNGQSVRALEDEARLLSETTLNDGPIPQRHLLTVRDQVFDVESVSPLAPPEPALSPSSIQRNETTALLDDLATRRGVRQAVDLSDDDDALFDSRDSEPRNVHPQGSRFNDGSSADDHTDLEATTPVSHNTSQSPARIYSLRPATSTAAIAGVAESDAPVAGDSEASDATSGNAAPMSAAPAVQPADEVQPTDSVQPAADTSTPGPDEPVAATPATPTAKPRAARKGRPQVPSWDEIVFGTKQD